MWSQLCLYAYVDMHSFIPLLITFQVLDMRIPFLLSSIKDFQQHVPNGQDSMVRLWTFLIQRFSQSENVNSWAL